MRTLTIISLWVVTIVLWLAIVTGLMIGLAEYDYPVGTLSKDYFESYTEGK